MGVVDAPAWLLPAYVRHVVGAGATASVDDIKAAGRRLEERWTSPGREFHNLKHLADVLVRVDELDEETHEPDLVRLAAWYHGAVFDAADRKAYESRGGEDETASAAVAYTDLTELGVPEASARRVHDLVAALVRHSPDPTDPDCAVLCDADLAVLATEPQRYKAYLHDVRAEYAHLPAEDYVRARVRILRKLLARKTLFSSPLGAAWEEPARQNVSAELQRLEKELAKLDEAAAAVSSDDTGAGDAQP
ncbi:HD domain-containing protein [Cellulomonas composti]|uniref:Metal-dependent HD superfamily phosphohydrolase n=1 Tax=Cellulomonas composti TaxID=266130 RepID=A0A511JCY4_9CELL|nr:hypothetical protein [Cellulomonas composti]GEL95861.1 hypothetical protein CCO02nite_25190 [Cellulomonas composti]